MMCFELGEPGQLRGDGLKGREQTVGEQEGGWAGRGAREGAGLAQGAAVEMEGGTRRCFQVAPQTRR